jgi:hypothetical protein
MLGLGMQVVRDARSVGAAARPKTTSKTTAKPARKTARRTKAA